MFEGSETYSDECRPQPGSLGAWFECSRRERATVGSACALRTVSPFATMILGEVCGFCGREVGAPGYVIPDYDELGAFCNQECADRRFRLYLEEPPERGRCSLRCQSPCPKEKCGSTKSLQIQTERVLDHDKHPETQAETHP